MLTTADLDAAAEKFIRSQGATPAFKGLYDFPASVCTSINDEIVHGIPSRTRQLVFSLPAEKDDRIMPILDRWAELKRQLG